MTTPQFDTLRAAKTLKRGGFDETQAETVVKTLDQAVNENLGTKADLKLLRGEMKQGFTDANAATEKATTEAKAATEKAATEAKAATDKLRSDTNQGFTKSEAATKELRSDTNQGFTDANAATDKVRSDIEKAIIRADAANERRFATFYRHLWVVGASIVVVMITLFLVN